MWSLWKSKLLLIQKGGKIETQARETLAAEKREQIRKLRSWPRKEAKKAQEDAARKKAEEDEKREKESHSHLI